MIGTVDLIVIAVIIVSVIFALYRGLLRELLGITNWILAAFGAVFSYESLEKFFTSRVEKVQIWTIVSSVLIALVILIIMTLINGHITGKLRKSSLSGLDRILGAIFGVFRAALLIVLVWMFARQMILPASKTQELTSQNMSVPYMNQGSDWVIKILPERLQEVMKQTPRKKIAKPVQQQYPDQEREKLEKMIGSIVEVDVDEE